ncbi:hypothetical protein [Ruthenibacterium lactatiformans]|uniref:hypothetical protein n=1 Tax=Ruthenibacterium lactatiformans TaxID=1550024 RepID=UPI00242BCDD5|nr:hypothetical protein [Ruthenibacterium lactatiformans]
MLKITLKNGKEYGALDGTAIYPSSSPNARSRMEIHMSEDAMTAYCLVASIGKKRVSKTDIATGQVVEEMHLVAELEQRTYIEQQLAALGL